MPAFQIDAEIKNANAILRRLKESPAAAQKELRRAMLEAELLYEAEVKENTPVGVTNILRGSISAQDPVLSGDNIIGVVGTSVTHAVPVELGTRPHFPPLEPLEDWVRLKLNVDADRAPAVALQIARKIAARGTEGVHMFENALETIGDTVERIFARANLRIVRGVAN